MKFDKRQALIFAILMASFVSRGFPESVLGVVWPVMRADLGVPVEFAGKLSTILKLGGVAASAAAGYLCLGWNLGITFAAGCALVMITMFGYVYAPGWNAVMLLTIPTGIALAGGSTLSNIYAARFYSSRLMNLLNFSWGLAVAAATFFAASLLRLGYSWRAPYISIGAAQLFLGAFFLLTSRVWKTAGSLAPAAPERVTAGSNIFAGRKKLRRSYAAYGVFGFIYSGLEVTPGLWIATFMSDIMGASVGDAGFAVSVYWISFTAGRLFAGIIGSCISDAAMIRISLAVAAAGAALLSVSNGVTMAMAACLIFGFGVGPVFPLMLHDAPRRVGGAASGGIIGITIAANFTGAAVLPTLIGYVAARASISVLGPALVAFAIAVAAAHEFSARNSIS